MHVFTRQRDRTEHVLQDITLGAAAPSRRTNTFIVSEMHYTCLSLKLPLTRSCYCCDNTASSYTQLQFASMPLRITGKRWQFLEAVVLCASSFWVRPTKSSGPTRSLAEPGSSADTYRHVCHLKGVTGVDKGGGPPNGRAKKKGRGYFYQTSNMYSCIAYLIKIRKFCSKNLFHKGVNFEAQNALKLTYKHL